MRNAGEHVSCPVLGQPDNYHFEGRCEDCDVSALIGLGLGKVEDRYQAGRLSQSMFEAYMHVWAVLAPSGSRAVWRETPQDPDVRRIARKVLRARDFEIPADLVDGAAVTVGDSPTRLGLGGTS